MTRHIAIARDPHLYPRTDPDDGCAECGAPLGVLESGPLCGECTPDALCPDCGFDVCTCNEERETHPSRCICLDCAEVSHRDV